MTEDNISLQETEASTSKQRKRRKWDEPHESLLSGGAISSGTLPVATAGCPGVSLSGLVSPSAPSSSSMKVGNVGIQASLVQQQAAAMVQKLNEPKIQDDLIIAREIVINDADPAMRYKLTKRQTQEEIQKCTGAVVITRGKYRPPNAVPDGEKALYLHISAGAHLKETAERILAVDHAAAIVEDMLKQVSQPLSTCIYLGFDADPSLNIAARIHGPNDQYINHIINETGAMVVLRGRGSGSLGNIRDEEEQQPLHLLLSSNNQKSLEDAKLLAENLLDTISRECGANRASLCKVYNAVPPPQQLLVGVQSGTELHSELSSTETIACSAAATMPVPPLPQTVVPAVPNSISYGQVMQPGASLALGHTLTNGLPYSQSSFTACTSYSAYAGIYPQSTPLQQVASALRQSGPFSSTVVPATTTSKVMPKCSSASEKRKRKFQESPAASQQGPQLQALCKCPSSLEKNKQDTVLAPPSLNSPLSPVSSSSTPSLASRSMPLLPNSLKSMLPPSPPLKSIRPPQPLPLPKSMDPASPARMLNPSLSVGTMSDNYCISNRTTSLTIPDTLGKLMEYGDDDDDPEECENESCKDVAKLVVPSKPFWAV